MKTRLGVGLLAAALLVPVLAACGSDDSKNETKNEAAIPADPKQALTEAAKALDDGNFRYQLSGPDIEGTGAVDISTNNAHITLNIGDPADEFSMEAEYIYIGTDGWIRSDVSGFGSEANPTAGKFRHVDVARLPESSDVKLKKDEVDPISAKALLNAIVEVQKTGEGSYSGFLDATKVESSQVVDEELLTGLGDQASKVPFTAKIDAQGRLIELATQIPAYGDNPAGEYKVAYSDFGAVTGIKAPPAADVVEAEDDFYEMLG